MTLAVDAVTVQLNIAQYQNPRKVPNLTDQEDSQNACRDVLAWTCEFGARWGTGALLPTWSGPLNVQQCPTLGDKALCDVV